MTFFYMASTIIRNIIFFQNGEKQVMKLPYITNIQRYSIHDGRGIRTTVFFKGCPLSCAWCHNPETRSFSPEVLVNPQICTGCGTCREVCPQQAVSGSCTGCEICLDYCVNNAREISGKQYTVGNLVKELEKDRAFYEQSGGGVTLSGGEVLAQDMDYVENLARELKRRGLSVNIDTCGAVSFDRFERILPWTDTFLYDIKLFDEENARHYTGTGAGLILDNLERLSRALEEHNAGGTHIWIRMPVIGGVNDTLEHMERTAHFLKEKKIHYSQVNLLAYHNTGSSKYARLGQVYTGEDFYVPSEEQMEKFSDYLKEQGISNVKTGG